LFGGVRRFALDTGSVQDILFRVLDRNIPIQDPEENLCLMNYLHFSYIIKKQYGQY